MAVYRFKIYWEENSDVERIIIIKPQQTFLDFFNIITQSFELNTPNVSASFFTSDDYWDKYDEITLKPEDIQGDEKLMQNTTIASLIEQPNQKFVFVYDAQLQLTFHIELIKIEPDNKYTNETLPKVISSKNKIPKNRKQIKKTNVSSNTHSSLSDALSDEELDKIIYSKLMNQNISEEDILNGNLDAILGNNEAEEEEQDEESETEDFFDEDDDLFDEEDFNDNEYFDSNQNDEN